MDEGDGRGIIEKGGGALGKRRIPREVGQCAWELGLPNGRRCHFLSDPCVF